MEIKQYLIETFEYNDRANRQILEAIEKLPEQEQAIKFYSHLINSQKKWMARIQEFPNNPEMSWWDPVYSLQNLEPEWADSLNAWIRFLEKKQEQDLIKDVLFIGYDGSTYAAKLKDIALQLNYHSIHHRAQIQALIRAQGFDAPFVDYIGTVYRKIE